MKEFKSLLERTDRKRQKFERKFEPLWKARIMQQGAQTAKMIAEGKPLQFFLDSSWLDHEPSLQLEKDLYYQTGLSFLAIQEEDLKSRHPGITFKSRAFPYISKNMELDPDRWEAIVDLWIQGDGAETVLLIDAESEEVMRAIIKEELEIGAAEGYGPEKIGLEIRRRFTANELDLELIDKRGVIHSAIVRGRRIARTEVLGASSFASYKSAEEVSQELDKVWIAWKDENTRLNHINAGKERINHSERFVSTGLLYPGDQTGTRGASETANCRCAVGWRLKEDV